MSRICSARSRRQSGTARSAINWTLGTLPVGNADPFEGARSPREQAPNETFRRPSVRETVSPVMASGSDAPPAHFDEYVAEQIVARLDGGGPVNIPGSVDRAELYCNRQVEVV